MQVRRQITAALLVAVAPVTVRGVVPGRRGITVGIGATALHAGRLRDVAAVCHLARVRLGSRPLAFALAFATVCPSGGVAAGRHGSLDPTFGAGGIVISPIPRGASSAGIAFAPDGGFLLAIGDMADDLVVRRYTRAGHLDRSYGREGASAVVHGLGGQVAIAFAAGGQGSVAAEMRNGRRSLAVRHGTD